MEKNKDQPGVILKIEDLIVEYSAKKGKKLAVNRFSLTIKEGECVGLVGESGCGKSTLANAIMGFVPFSSGKICLKGNQLPLKKLTQVREHYTNVQMIFQNINESMNLRQSVFDYIAEPLRNLKKCRRNDLDRQVGKLLEITGLPQEYGGRYPAQISGGEKQRVVIAKALAVQPKLIICDEPTSSLDVSVQALIIELLRKMQKDQQMAYLFISHDLPLVSYLCSRIVIMYEGEAVEVIPNTDLLIELKHPYSRDLLEATFSKQSDERKVKKQIRYHELQINGCQYYAYCELAIGVCNESRPQLKKIGEGHEIACHRYGGKHE